MIDPDDYARDGYVVVEHFLGQLTIDALIAAAHSIRTTEDFSPLMNPHRCSTTFKTLMADREIAEVVHRLTQAPISGLQSQFFFGVPATQGYSRHQDNFFVEAPYGALVSAWIALVDVAPENGGLQVWKGSHKYVRLPVRRLPKMGMDNQDPNAANEETILPDGLEPTDLVLSAGTVVFLHGSLVHASHCNSTKTNRYAVLNTYIRKGAPFRKGKRAQREEVEL